MAGRTLISVRDCLPSRLVQFPAKLFLTPRFGHNMHTERGIAWAARQHVLGIGLAVHKMTPLNGTFFFFL